MASIVFLIDTEYGHATATFKLAHALGALGHQICYAGPPSAENLIRANRLEFIPILHDVYSEPVITRGAMNHRRRQKPRTAFEALVKNNALDDVIQRVRPDAVLVNSIQPLEALAIKYRYGIPAILLAISFPVAPRQTRCRAVIGRFMELQNGGESELLEAISARGIAMKSLEDLAVLASGLPELVFLPSSFDLPGEDQEPHLHHIGPFVDLNRAEPPWDWNGYDDCSRIAYASLGSNSELKPDLARIFFKTVLQAFGGMHDWRLIMSIGRGFKVSDFGPLPPNVSLHSSVPQIRVLSRANIMLTHAGAGTVKECILLGVPMLLFPLMRDQFECASRVAGHGLGLHTNITDMTTDQVVSMVTRLFTDASYKSNLEAARRMFAEADSPSLAARVIEKSIAGNRESGALHHQTNHHQ